MRRLLILLTVVSLLALPHLAAPFARAEQPAHPSTDQTRFFDPARHMRVSEVRPGMKGYGLSVFHGTRIEKFGVEVISILHDFNPKFDVILVRLSGQNLEHTGSIAGMSGSPIYLYDDTGKARLVGAFAYGWPLMKDPIGGVQPIEYMLKIHKQRRPNQNLPSTNPTSAPASTEPVIGRVGTAHLGVSIPKEVGSAHPAKKIHWNLSDVVMLPGMTTPPPNYPFASLNSTKPNPRLGVDDDAVTQMRPLATPLMTGGMSQKLLDQLSPLLHAYGLTPLQAGGIAPPGAGPPDPANSAKLEPGSVLAVPLLTGDVEMTAVGTCTEVIGNKVWGFGHPFNNEGAISLPLAGGEINGIIANLMTSFKLGAMGRTWGTLFADEQVGVAGQIGQAPPTIPIDIKVHYTDGSGDRDYHFDAAWHPKFTPLLSAAAISSAVTGLHDLPEYNTIDYHATIEFANGQQVKLANSLVNVSMPELFGEFGVPMIAAAQNPFEKFRVKRITGVMNITPMAREADILWVNTPRLKFRPGETLEAFVNYRPFRAADSVIPIEFPLPRDLPEGTYQLTVSGWEQFLSDERTAKPFRFSAESAQDVFSVIRDLVSFRHDAIYVRLVRAPDGIAIGRTAMPNLPSSMREVLLGAGRSNTTPFVSSATKIIPCKDLMAGSAQFQVTIDKNAHVETGVGKPPPRRETPIAPAAAPPTTPKTPAVPVVPAPEPGGGSNDPGATD
jgi:hypothetical protein